MAVRVKLYTKEFMKKLDIDNNNKLKESLQVLVEDIKDNTPVKTGTLRDSITGFVDDKEDFLEVGTDIEYAKYVEFGTVHMAPRYFMTKGYRSAVPKIKRIFKRKLQ